MSTKPPSPVAEFPAESLEKLAYSVVEDIPVLEPNDRSRLGYHIWAWLKERSGTLEQAIKTSGSRTDLSLAEVYARIVKRLEEKGIKIQ